MDDEDVRAIELYQVARLLRWYNKQCRERGEPEEQFGLLFKENAEGRRVGFWKRMKDMDEDEAAQELRISTSFLLDDLDDAFDDDDQCPVTKR
jgi:hypothetical protein